MKKKITYKFPVIFIDEFISELLIACNFFEKRGGNMDKLVYFILLELAVAIRTKLVFVTDKKIDLKINYITRQTLIICRDLGFFSKIETHQHLTEIIAAFTKKPKK